MLKKLGIKTAHLSDITPLMLEHRMITPLKFLNRVMDGVIDPAGITHVYKDEAHHDVANTYDRIDTCLPDYTKHVGTTATPFRATAKGTAALRAKWDDLYVALTYPAAAEQGYIKMPTCETWPLVDDDLLEVKGADFEIVSLCSAVGSKLEDALTKAIERGMFLPNGKPSQPMIIGVPSSTLFPDLAALAVKYSLKLEYINESTPTKQRTRIFAAATRGDAALVHINVVSEGIDFPFRQYLDLTPTRSAVAFMQRFGRITRPTEDEPLYVCTNRNLESHGYLLEGCLPASAFAEVQSVFGGPTTRSVGRIAGLESLGRIKPCYTKCVNGVTVTFYCVSAVSNGGTERAHYAVILHPAYQGVLWFHRTQINIEGAETDWGRWSHLPDPPGRLTGFSSVTPSMISEKQLAWWKGQGRRPGAQTYGLDPTQTVNAKQFQILPVLENSGFSLDI